PHFLIIRPPPIYTPLPNPSFPTPRPTYLSDAGRPDAAAPRADDDGPPAALLAGGAVAGLVVIAGIVLLVAHRGRAR
ncbi:hypothetical protein ABZU22_19270, partial [Micromonospora sp. NPDC005222]